MGGENTGYMTGGISNYTLSIIVLIDRYTIGCILAAGVITMRILGLVTISAVVLTHNVIFFGVKIATFFYLYEIVHFSKNLYACSYCVSYHRFLSLFLFWQQSTWLKVATVLQDPLPIATVYIHCFIPFSIPSFHSIFHAVQQLETHADIYVVLEIVTEQIHSSVSKSYQIEDG